MNSGNITDIETNCGTAEINDGKKYDGFSRFFSSLLKLMLANDSSVQFTELRFNFCPKKSLKINNLCQAIPIKIALLKAKIIFRLGNNRLAHSITSMSLPENDFF